MWSEWWAIANGHHLSVPFAREMLYRGSHATFLQSRDIRGSHFCHQLIIFPKRTNSDIGRITFRQHIQTRTKINIGSQRAELLSGNVPLLRSPGLPAVPIAKLSGNMVTPSRYMITRPPSWSTQTNNFRCSAFSKSEIIFLICSGDLEIDAVVENNSTRTGFFEMLNDVWCDFCARNPNNQEFTNKIFEMCCHRYY